MDLQGIASLLPIGDELYKDFCLWMTLTLRTCLISIFIIIFSSVLLSESYLLVSKLRIDAWVAAALINTAIGVGTFWFWKKGYLNSNRPASQFRMEGWRAYMPAVAVLIGTTLLTSISQAISPNPGKTALLPNWTTILGWTIWVPLVEELVFRVGFGGFFRRLCGIAWGSYFSVALFSLMHTLPTMERLLSGEVGFTVGTLLLGTACELVWVFSRSFGAIFALHAVCNVTGVLFSVLDPRWLSWLSPLYL